MATRQFHRLLTPWRPPLVALSGTIHSMQKRQKRKERRQRQWKHCQHQLRERRLFGPLRHHSQHAGLAGEENAMPVPHLGAHNLSILPSPHIVATVGASHVHNICLGGTGVCCTHAAISCCNQQWVCMHTFTCILWHKTSLASLIRSSVFGAATTSSRKQKKREHFHIEGLQAQASSTTPACKKLNASLVLRCR